MSLPEGVQLAAGDAERIEAAIEELKKNNDAPRVLTVHVTLHVHHEYPKHLYKGAGIAKLKTVASADEESAARADGYGEFQPELAKEEA